jgi:hypothetical protein
VRRGLSLLALSIVCLNAQQSFPITQAETLTGKKVTVPDGHPAVFIIGFTHASQTQTKAWSLRVSNQLPTWSVSVLEDVPRLMRGMVTHAIKSSIPKEQHERFLLVYHNEKKLKQATGFDKQDDAYLVVVDAGGAIKWRYHGAVTDDAVKQLTAQFGS